MSNSQAKEFRKKKPEYVLKNPLPKHFDQIQKLCKKVYPFSKPWSIEQLESHRSYFPDGQLIVVEKETDKVVGLAFSLIIVWNDYSPQDNWQDFTSGGFFHNHNPREGKTLYGAEVMVDPECRGRGIGKMLYMGRQEIVAKYQLKRIRAGARLQGYSKYKDKLAPEEYVKNVVEKKIYDSTLSFQLNQNFKAIDVAQNYLFNDPDSLGYAAVIEWLNPKTNTEKDFEKQRQSIELFMSGEKFVPKFLPMELRHLVRKTTTALGRAIRDLEGEAFYHKVEIYREQLKKSRSKSQNKETLRVLSKKLEKESRADLLKLAHAFSLQLEVVNVCEAAYRTWRQKQKPQSSGIKNKLNLSYVLTAHPTEARSKEVLENLSLVQKLLVEGIQNKFLFNDRALSTRIKMLWLQSITKKQKPTVVDEAEYIFTTVFAPDILDFILQEKRGYELKLRTWVGGDKDGHPGVDKTVMKECLNRSRQYLVEYAEQRLANALSDLAKIQDTKKVLRAEVESLQNFREGLKKIKIISNGEGTKIKTWTTRFNTFYRRSSPFIREHEQILLLNRVLALFPAFVLPIEMREDASLIAAALKDPTSTIREMLAELARISGALNSTLYARGLIISHCENENDITNACRLVDLSGKNPSMPVIPLFESQEALIAGKKILKNWLQTKRNHDRAHRHWNKKFEVMLGYSDSAKQSGVLPSRLLIAKAMQEIDRTLKGAQLKPVFFHGSGGSVARGGGSLKEQISWWSQSAIENPKMTVQGEMIQRLFASKEILNSQCVHMTIEAQRRKVRRLKNEKTPELEQFAKLVSTEYRHLVEDTDFLGTMLGTTPYRYLDVLKIGSRPSKRAAKNVSLDALRAIPWVLCWTQTRLLLPTWWGVGSAWVKLTPAEKTKLKELFSRDPFFSSFVKALAFTAAKVDLDVWSLYLNKTEENHKEIAKKIRTEFDAVLIFLYEITQQKQLLWYRPWLGESIRLRSPHINLLNLIQIIAMQTSDEALLQETIVGIACGMLTTG